MHTFQPIDVHDIDFNNFTKIGKEWMLIAAGDETKANAMTASWGGTGVLWNKNVVFIFVRESRYTKEFIDSHDTFSLNFFDHTYKPALTYFGKISGRDEDKLANTKMNVALANDTPYIDEANIVITCRKLSATKITPDQFIDKSIEETAYPTKDYHTMYVGEITEFMAR